MSGAGALMNGPVIVRNITRADQDIVGQLADAGVATVHEAMGREGLSARKSVPFSAALASPDPPSRCYRTPATI